MGSLKEYFEQTNLNSFGKEKAFNFVDKFDNNSFGEDSDVFVGRTELFYIINKFKKKEDLYFQIVAANNFYDTFFNQGNSDERIYPALNHISNNIFQAEKFSLENVGYQKDENEKDFSMKKIIFLFEINQKKYETETFTDQPTLIFDFINNYIEKNKLSEKRFYIFYTGSLDAEEYCIVFIDTNQYFYLNKYFGSYYI